MAWRRYCAILLCIALTVISAGCLKEDILSDDLSIAKEAYMERNLPLAERLLERYLRNEQNPEKRWQAWELLLKAINSDSQEPRASLECLEAMLVEYGADGKKLAFILAQMGKYNKQLRHYDRAADAWSTYLELADIDNTERVEGFRNLAAMQFGQRHFEAGEETLQECLALPFPDHDKIYCMLDLADAHMIRDHWQEVADLCHKILASEPDKSVYGMAGYLLGDALEQMGKYKEALQQFELARDSYPNPAVMDNRIKQLKKIIREKKIK